MFKARHATAVFASIILIPLSFCSYAQVVDVSDCRAIEDRLQRFDCYESLEAADPVAPQSRSAPEQPAARSPAIAQPAIVAPPAPPAPPAATATTESQTVQSFGDRARSDAARVIEGTDGKSELIDEISALDERLPNTWLITLESGQRWMQMESKRYPMKVGEEVRIYSTRWGNAYRLTSPRLSSFIQVERVD